MSAIDKVKQVEISEATAINLAKMKKKLIFLGVIFGIVLIIVGSIFIKGYASATEKYKAKLAEKDAEIEKLIKIIEEKDNEPDVVNPVSPDIVMDVMNTEIKSIGELATVNYLFTNAAKFTDSKQIKNWNIPFTEKSFIVKWDGEIRAGVVVDEVEITVDDEEKKVTVSIPCAQIFSYSVTRAEVLDENNNILNQITIDDKVKFDTETEREMKERAIESGLLEKAQKSAEEIIVKLFNANTMISEQYSIECKTK